MIYAIVNIKRINDRDAFQQYADQVAKIIPRFGGRYLVSEKSPEVHEGEFPYARIVIAEFPTMEDARLWYLSPEYQAIIPTRRRAFDANIFFARDFEATTGIKQSAAKG